MSGFAATPLTDPQADQILTAVRSMLSLELLSPQHVQPGQLISAQVVPASPVLDVSQLVNGFVNLAYTTKDVLFSDTSIADVPDSGSLGGDDVASALPNLVSKALPFPPAQAILNGGTNTTPPGVLGQLFGAIALPKLDVRVAVAWVVRRPNGTVLGEGRDFVAPN